MIKLQCSWSVFVTKRQTMYVCVCVCVLVVCETVLLIHRQCNCRQLPLAVFCQLYWVSRACYTAAHHWRLSMCACFYVCLRRFCVKRDTKQIEPLSM